MKEWAETPRGLSRRFDFADFAAALLFVNKIAEIAEQMQHHPDVQFGWGYVEVVIFTHSSHSITDKDHELAARIDALTD